jgi:hypothetical protein
MQSGRARARTRPEETAMHPFDPAADAATSSLRPHGPGPADDPTSPVPGAPDLLRPAPERLTLFYQPLWLATADGPRLLMIAPEAPAALRALVGRADAGSAVFDGPAARGDERAPLAPVRWQDVRLLPRSIPADVARDAPELAAALTRQPRGAVCWGDLYRMFQQLTADGLAQLGPTADVTTRLSAFGEIRAVLSEKA